MDLSCLLSQITLLCTLNEFQRFFQILHFCNIFAHIFQLGKKSIKIAVSAPYRLYMPLSDSLRNCQVLKVKYILILNFTKKFTIKNKTTQSANPYSIKAFEHARKPKRLINKDFLIKLLFLFFDSFGN